MDNTGTILLGIIVVIIVAVGVIALVVDNVSNDAMCEAFGYNDWDRLLVKTAETRYDNVRCFSLDEAPTLSELLARGD